MGNPQAANTNAGRFLNMFATVIAACWLSAPGNELRGYCLQPPDKKQSFGEFFQPAKFLRSTSVGSVIMAISLGVGTLATPQVEKFVAKLKEYMKTNPLGYLLIILFAVHQVLENRRAVQLRTVLDAKQGESDAKIGGPDAKAKAKS